MNPINLHLTFSDGSTRTTTCGVSDIMKFEEHFDKSVSDFQRGLKLSWLVYLAWVSETRLGATSLDFDAYTDSLTSIEVPDPKK